jgi:hypothetical protein
MSASVAYAAPVVEVSGECGAPAFDEMAADRDDVHIVFTSAPTADGVSGTVAITVGAYNETRALTAASCDELSQAASIVIALALREPAAAPVPAAPPPLPPPPAPIVVEPSLGWRLLFGAAASNDGNVDIRLGGGLRRRRWSLDLELRVAPESDQAAGSGRILVETREVSVAPCVDVSVLTACALVSAGYAHGAGEHLMDATTANKALFSVGGRLAWEHRLFGSVGVRVFADIEQPVAKTRFFVDDQVAWTNNGLAVWGGASAFLRLP